MVFYSKTIGILVPQIVHYFFSTIISGIEEVLNEAGYNAMICQSAESYDKEVENTHTLFSSRIDGLIVSVTKETENSDHFRELIDSTFVLVRISTPASLMDCTSPARISLGRRYSGIPYLIIPPASGSSS